jgi:hypothetical protein
MIETHNMHYEMIYSPDVVERLKELVEADYSAKDCLDFIDNYGEEDFLEYYDILVEFESDHKSVNIQTLINYYSNFSFLDLEFMGEYPSERSFIEYYYCEIDRLSPLIIIDWQETISRVKKLFDFVPTNSGFFYIFAK